MRRPPPKRLARTGLVSISDNLAPGQQVRPDARLFNRLLGEDVEKIIERLGGNHSDDDSTESPAGPGPGD